MHPETGDVRKFSTDEEAKAAGYTVPIPESEREGVAAMNRAQRRAWAKAHGLPMHAARVDVLQVAQAEAARRDRAGE